MKDWYLLKRNNMKRNDDVYDIVNKAIDIAFTQQKYNLNFYEYLRSEKYNKEEIIQFNTSSLYTAMNHQVEELDIYLNGGEKYDFIKEAYNWMGKLRIQKLRDYLKNIMEDAKKFERSKNRGRKPKAISNK